MAEDFDAYYEWLGIPPKDQPPNHYRLLGIELFETNSNVIDRAADRQMGHVRTFQTGRHARESQQLLNELSKAKLCLLNAEKKAAYDAELQGQINPSSVPDLPPPVREGADIDAALPPAATPFPPGLPPGPPVPPQISYPVEADPLAQPIGQPSRGFDFAPRRGTSAKLAAMQRRKRRSMWPAAMLLLSAAVAIVLGVLLALLSGLI